MASEQTPGDSVPRTGPADRIDPGDPADRGTAPVLPDLGLRGTARWVWRQLTSMRVALMLLMTLAVVSVPGSVFPQRPQDPASVARFLRSNPVGGRWLDRLGFFDVYGSVWFSAVYLLLFVSLVGCILPRLWVHLTAFGARPPRAPRRFERFEVHAELVADASPDEVIAAATRALRGGTARLRGFRVDVDTEPDGARTLAAERGSLRESGNILFHLALVGLLVAIASGQLLHYRGQAIVVEGRGFANSPSDYDTFETGTAFRPGSLVPFSLTLDTFTAEFDVASRPTAFQADVTLREASGSTRTDYILVNRPLDAGGAKVYLQGNGYAPQVTVRDAAGNVAFAGSVPFLPKDASYRSEGVVKVPDVTSGDQIGLVGSLLPTAVASGGGFFSAYPQPGNPLLVLQVWRGDLGLDTGIPQNVYQLDSDAMTQVMGTDGAPVTLLVEEGATVDLPDGLGTLTFDALPRFAAFDLRYDPSLPWAASSAVCALLGLALSLFTPRRRLWLRVRAGEGDHAGRTVVAGAALARTDDAGLAAELDRVLDAVGTHDEGQDRWTSAI